jgi:hypothetical protein
VNYVPFAPRRIEPLGLIERDGYRLKLYSVVYGAVQLARNAFDAGLDLVLGVLPRPAVHAGRPGLGFVIFHQGRTGSYVVLCWWDRENELPTRVFVRDGERWRPATGTESFCVWDLEIMWHERCAYTRTILGGNAAGAAERYIGETALVRTAPRGP